MSTTARLAVGRAAAERVQPGMVVGLGTGDTAACFIRALAERAQHDPALGSLRCVATSQRSAQLGSELGLLVIDIDTLESHAAHPVDLTVDGADEIDPRLQLVKGAGGALLFEKLVAQLSRELVIVGDRSKQVQALGEKRRLPIEIVRFAARHTLPRIRRIDGIRDADLRLTSDGTPYITDGGNFIVDAAFACPTQGAAKLHSALKALPGIVETGFFLSEATCVLISDDAGHVQTLQR